MQPYLQFIIRETNQLDAVFDNKSEAIDTAMDLPTLKKVKECIAVYGNPSHSYGVSLAIWDHTVLPATRHK